MNLDEILLQAQSPDKVKREEAENFILKGANNDYFNFLLVCSQYIQEEKNQEGSRQLCGTVISNLISGGFVTFKGKWLSLDSSKRQDIKDLLLPVLGSKSKKVRNQVSTCISSICAQEFPKNEWLDILAVLDKASTNQDISFRCSSMTTLKNIMQDVPPGVISDEDLAVVMFTILKNLNVNDPSEVRVESLQALLYSISSASSIFRIPEQRSLVTNVIYTSLTYPEDDQQILGLRCLAECMKYHYEHMENEVEKVINLSQNLVQQNNHDKVVQVYEIWCCASDEEVYRIENNYHCKNIIFKKENELLNMCIYSLSTRDNEEDEDEWLPYKGATMLMRNMSLCCSRSYINNVMNQITLLINKEEPKLRDSAMHMFGSLIKSAHSELIRTTIIEGLENILAKLKDKSTEVQKTTSFVIEKICENHILYLNEKQFEIIIKTIYNEIETNTTNRKVVCNMISCLHQISMHFNPKDQTSKIN